MPIGYSDHTTEPMAGALAVMAGAVLVERHLTYDRSAAGPDHAASSDPDQFAAYVKAIRIADAMRGSGNERGRRVLPIEHDVRRVSRQSLVLRRAVRSGQVLTAADLTVHCPVRHQCRRIRRPVVGCRMRADSEAGATPARELLQPNAEVADAA